VRTERFVGSGHVSHVVEDGERYWGIVEDVVEDGIGHQKK
jgi:hypothetical protein